MRNFVIRIVGICLTSCVMSFPVFAGSGQWRIITAMTEARDAVHHDGVVYIVTNGGMYSYSNNGGRIDTYTPAEGLSAIDLRAVAADESGTIWIGAAGGYIDGFNPNDLSTRRVTDITRADFPQRDITTLETRGDTLFVGTSYGISIYSLSREEFNDTYIKFGDFPTQTPVSSIAFDDTYIWVGTSLGIARGKIDDPLLAAPNRWTIYTTSDTGAGAFPLSNINDILIDDETVYIGMSGGAAWYDGVSWTKVNGLDEVEVIALELFDGTVYAATERNIYRISNDEIISQYGPQLPTRINSLARYENGIIAAMADFGIALLQNNTWDTIAPAGPQTNILTDIFAGADNIMWIATAPTGAAGRGFYRYDPAAEHDEQWKAYTVQQYSELQINSYYKIFGASDGTIWASSHGRGITALRPDGSLRNYYLDDGLVGIKDSPTYVVASRAGEDSEGNIWFTLLNMAEDKPLVKLKPESSEITLLRNERNPAAIRLNDLIVDRFDTAWITSSQNGLFYYNERESIGSNVAGWGVVTTTNGLPTNIVHSVVEDTRGEIWVGTGQGLAAIGNPREPQTTVRDVFVLQDQIINAIAVDPLNRKWIGTQEGVFLLSPDATQLIEHYNVDNTNSKLVSNEVLAIAFDDNSGTVYFGTNNGISSLQTIAVAPRASFNELIVSPNPYMIPSDHEIKIDGLIRNSEIAIISVDGRLVRSFKSPGGRVAYWDGRDNTGREVASGVYIVIGYTEDGSEVGKSKITVIRR